MIKTYKIKEGKKEQVREYMKNNNIKTQKELSEITGLGEDYISGIINGKKTNIKKTSALAFCKAISPDLEIEDLFDISEKNF